MTKIVMTAKAVITDVRGEGFVVERTIVADTQDNPRFWAATVNTDLTAIVDTVTNHVEQQFGQTPRTIGDV